MPAAFIVCGLPATRRERLLHGMVWDAPCRGCERGLPAPFSALFLVTLNNLDLALNPGTNKIKGFGSSRVFYSASLDVDDYPVCL